MLNKHKTILRMMKGWGFWGRRTGAGVLEKGGMMNQIESASPDFGKQKKGKNSAGIGKRGSEH